MEEASGRYLGGIWEAFGRLWTLGSGFLAVVFRLAGLLDTWTPRCGDLAAHSSAAAPPGPAWGDPGN